MTSLRPALGWGAALVVYGLVLLLRTVGAIAPDASAWPWAALAAGLALLGHPTARQQGSATWPVVLTVVGGLFAIRELGGLPLGVPLVPVLLVVAGIALLTSAVSARAAPATSEEIAVPLQGAGAARLVLAHGAGSLRVTDGAGEELVCEGRAEGGVRAQTHRVGDRLEVTLRPPGDVERLVRAHRALDWRLALPRGLPLELEVRTGASRVELDLERTAVTSVIVKTGASDLDLVVPGAGRCRVTVDAGAADVDVRVPPQVAASIRARSALASVDVDTARFPRAGEGYRSAGFDEATDRVEVELDGGIASFRVR